MMSSITLIKVTLRFTSQGLLIDNVPLLTMNGVLISFCSMANKLGKQVYRAAVHSYALEQLTEHTTIWEGTPIGADVIDTERVFFTTTPSITTENQYTRCRSLEHDSS